MKKSISIEIINGPNLNLLGKRNPEIYGSGTLEDLEEFVKDGVESYLLSQELENFGVENIQCNFFQSNHEGALIDKIQEIRETCDAIVINPGAYSHYSYAIRDALEDSDLPVYEVHISDISNRESFRNTSVTSDVCIGVIKGKGFDGYLEATKALIEKVIKNNDKF